MISLLSRVSRISRYGYIPSFGRKKGENSHLNNFLVGNHFLWLEQEVEFFDKELVLGGTFGLFRSTAVFSSQTEL